MTPERRRDILQISLPIVAGMTSQNLLNLVDAWMVGALGATALAAVGLASFVNFMAVSFLTGFSPAVQTLAARRVGQGRMSEVAVPLNGGLRLSLWIGAVSRRGRWSFRGSACRWRCSVGGAPRP